MKSIATVLVLVGGLLVQGCALTSVEPTDLFSVRLGATRDQVEAALGKPIETRLTEHLSPKETELNLYVE